MPKKSDARGKKIKFWAVSWDDCQIFTYCTKRMAEKYAKECRTYKPQIHKLEVVRD